MALASWSTRRILTLWAGGLSLQALLILAPMLLARHVMATSAQMLRVGAEQNARWRAGELADSLSLANQRADARAARSYAVTASSDTFVALVHLPSGRPDSADVAVGYQRTLRKVRYFTLAVFGLIPSLLILVTLSWLIVCRRNRGPTQSAGAS